MPLITTRAVVLQTYRYSDTSKILRLMTREHGPRSVVARGALRPRSRFGGLLEPFAEGTATLYVKENRDLHTLSAFELRKERQALGSDLQRFAGASVLCEVVLRLAPEHRDVRLYSSLVEGLDALLAVPREAVPATALRQIWHLVRLLGFAPDLEGCVRCGRPIPPDREAIFDLPAGGLRCSRCGAEDGPRPTSAQAGPRLSPGELAALRSLAGGLAVPSRLEGAQGRFLADFIRQHLAEGTRLRSLDFLRGLA